MYHNTRWEPDRRRPLDPANPAPLTALTVLIREQWNSPRLRELQARANQVIRPLLRGDDWVKVGQGPLRGREIEVTLFGIQDAAAAHGIAARLRRALDKAHVPATVGAAHQREGEAYPDTVTRAWRNHVPAVRRAALREDRAADRNRDRGWER